MRTQDKRVAILSRFMDTDPETGTPTGYVVYLVEPSGSDPEATEPYQVTLFHGVLVKCPCKGFTYTSKPEEDIKGHCYHGTGCEEHEARIQRSLRHLPLPEPTREHALLHSTRPPKMEAGVPMR
jgi:hypothetical protein